MNEGHFLKSKAVIVALAVAFCFVRMPLLVVGFGVASTAILLGDPSMGFENAWRQAANHAYVVVTLAADLPCLLMLAWAMRRENRSLQDLVRDPPQSRRQTVILGLMVFGIMALPFAALPPLTTWLVGAPPYPAGLTNPPAWVVAWTVLIFPFTTATTEELIYRAYALPRLRERFGPIAAVLVTAVGFGATHLLIPPLGTADTLLARFLTLAIVGVILELIYLRLKRIVPLILGHLLVDMLLIGGFAMATL